MSTEAQGLLAQTYQQSRRELRSYLTRIVLRPDIAEELVQQAAVKLVEAGQGDKEMPDNLDGMRAWLFRVATHLAIDHLRRHSTWRENIMLEAREVAEDSEAFLAESALLRGSAETSAIAREHLTVCFSCTLRNLPAQQAAALLLAEVYGFTVEEAAQILDASFGQTKNWIQAARDQMRDKYDATCALIAKQGVCHQCVELSEFFHGRKDDPLAGSARDIDARLAILRARREAELGPWHRLMMRLVDDVLKN
ncbi:RNA polymerase sigma factor [Piscinibacter sp.]|uniref:RNA polymerase sigma factor n=1 Tax=Piscinibacter sp. TaxID=1903157 RepID=UPI002C515CAC|nr:RNA polymerase sigma factor [Albitalea sp.]HUG25667.1 RNA polymerase sigma factor [Albitalea sp.]